MRVTHVQAENGGVLVWVAFWLPVLVLFIAFAVDVGNWFVHKRHLQLQADAGALAGGGGFTIPCSDPPILENARKYAGDPGSSGPYNVQIPPTQSTNVHVLINSESYWNEGGSDFSDGGTPCAARFVDVKITEADLPWYFRMATVPAINAHARVSIQGLTRAAGALPVAVPDVDPQSARAYFVNESTGAVIASTALTKTGVSNGLAVWDNAGAPLSLPIDATNIGVRLALGGGPSTTCGDKLVLCYDAGSANGLVSLRGYSTAGSGAQPNPPVARDVRLVPGSCQDSYFVSDETACTIGVSADVDFGAADPVTAVGARVSAVIAGVTRSLTYDAASGRWISAAGDLFTVNPNAGPLTVELRWAETSGSVTVGGRLETCTTTGGNKCTGSFGTVHRTFSAQDDRSGPVKIVELWEGGASGANSFPVGTTQDLVVKIAIQGNLAVAQSVSDPIVLLRVTGSQNQSVDCDPNLPNLREEIRYGCSPEYAINEGTTCPATATALWNGPAPWNCVAIQTGGAIGQVEQGLRDRILGGAPSCTSPNNWADFPNLPPGDPRIVPVFVTPFGTFTDSGNDVVPVRNFATFYVTGWFSSPCAGDDPVPDKGYIVGHFIKYVFGLNTGGGSDELCDFNTFGSCIAVMTD
jgi:Putative Flp pilus-assembly TadE/G-like